MGTIIIDVIFSYEVTLMGTLCIYLASNHVVHGDLACRNILVFHFDEEEPKKIVVKITDFGLSKGSQLY